MPTDHIIQLLRAEKSRIDAALLALEGGSAKRRGRPRKNADNVPDWAKTTPKKKGRKYTAAQRHEASKRMKARWVAARKKAPAKRKAAKAE